VFDVLALATALLVSTVITQATVFATTIICTGR
jgi:hypothetical protein